MNKNLTVYIGIGKRKTAIAKVYLTEGTGQIIINNIDSNLFFFNLIDEYTFIRKPFFILNLPFIYNIKILIKGGGIKAQMEAIQLAISKALCKINISFNTILKKNLLLHCDSRIKEVRKYGLKKARKASQYSKR